MNDHQDMGVIDFPSVERPTSAAFPTPSNEPALRRAGGEIDRRRSGIALLIAFVLGLGARLQVQIIGFIPLSELALVLLFPLYLPAYTRKDSRRSTRLLIPLGLLWLVFTIGTDIYRQTEFSLAARGFARVLVYLVSIPFCFLFFRTDTWRRLIWFTAGIIPSVVLSAYVLRGGVHEGRELVWGRALITFETHWVAVLVFGAQLVNLLLYCRARWLAYAASLGAGAFSIFNGSRAAGAAFAAAVPLTWGRNVLALATAESRGRGRPSWVVIALLGSLGLLIAWGVVETYSEAAREGYLGERAQRKFEAQSTTEVGLLLAGRVEFLGAILAVSDSPLAGHGSWKLDTDRYYARAIKWAGIDANPDVYYARGYPHIPAHSHLMGAWVDNGLGGAIFWAYVLLLTGKALVSPLGDERHLRLWVSCAATALIWHVLFSPISGRLETSIALAVFLTQADAARAVGQARSVELRDSD